MSVARPLPPIDPRYATFRRRLRLRAANGGAGAHRFYHAIEFAVSDFIALMTQVDDERAELHAITLIGSSPQGASPMTTQVFRFGWTVNQAAEEHAHVPPTLAFKVHFGAFHLDPSRIARIKVRAFRQFHLVESLLGGWNHPSLCRQLTIKWVAQPTPLRYCWITLMEHIHGHTLEAYIRTEPLPPTGLYARLVEQMASALVYAHAQNKVLRNIEPSNVMIRADLSRAVFIDVDQVELWQLGQPVDTKAVDMFAFGRILLQARVSIQRLTDAEVHQPDATLLDLARQLLEPASRFDALLLTILEPVPANRYTAQQFLAHWRRLMRD